ncbi:MAG: DDE-type integrase/transposase/recombinase [Gammaproteobacteria bacterium]
MQNAERLSQEEMGEFLEGSYKVRFQAEGRPAVYGFIEGVLRAQQYRRLSKGQKGIVRRYLTKLTGLSRAQVTRLLAQWRQTGHVEPKPVRRRRFPTRYSRADIALLVAVDTAHEQLSGPGVRRILERGHRVFGKAEYERLSGISVSHIYNLRHSETYRGQRLVVQHTQARQVGIGERRKPDPREQPGYLRVDTVHQGDQDGKPGVYHINAVDTVTQWQVVGCVETISERHLIPVLEAILHQFPFRIRGFHCDNGSEFINHRVAQLLNKLLVEFTKSRPYRTMDNALVEGKNGAVVRKHIGYGPIGAEHAGAFQKFYTAYFNPYLNWHRPCGFATVQISRRGERQRIYRAEDYRTPYEKLVALPHWQQYLKKGITADLLQREALRRSDTEAAQRMQAAKTALLSKSRRTR